MSSLPYLCLQEIFEFALHGLRQNKLNLKDLFSCILVCKIWSETAIPILWGDPFNSHNSKILIDVYLSNFTLEELKNLNIPLNLIEEYQKRRPKYDYARFLRRMNLTQIRAATTLWLNSSKNVRSKGTISKDCQIFQLLCGHFVSHASSIKYVEFEPEYNPIINFNIFNLPGAESSLSNLREFSCYGEAYNISLYEQASKISKAIHNLRISLVHGCPLNPSTLINLSNYIKSQRRLKEFSVNNRIGCYCCSQDISLALDLTIVFKSLNTQSITLSRISFISIDFHNYFPCDQLSQCINLKELNITRCWNFGDIRSVDDIPSNAFTHLSDLQVIISSIPEELVRILLIRSGKSLRNLEFEQSSYFGVSINILKYCSENNPKLVNVLVYIDPKEIHDLPKFLRSSTKLCNLEIWDKNTPNDIHQLMRLVEPIDLDDEIFADIGGSLPNSLANLTIKMKWKFSSRSLERFIKNCQAPLNLLGFEFCECFGNEHFDVLVKNLKRSLRKLNIRHCSAKLNSEIRMKNRYLIQYIDI